MPFGTRGKRARPLPCLLWFAALVSTMLFAAPAAVLAAPGDVTLCSKSYAGAMADDACLYPSISDDGRYVAFESEAGNLVSGITPGIRHIYRKDLQTGQVTLCSRSVTGAQGNGDSHYPDISADGSRVVFHSTATNLVTGEATADTQVFMKDLRSGVVTLCSRSAGGAMANSASELPSVNSDGRYISFRSAATNLVPDVPFSQYRIYRKDLASGEVRLCSTSSSGVQGNFSSNNPRINSDGRYVTFSSLSSNLIDGSVTSNHQAFRKDLVSGETLLCSSDDSWRQGNSDTYYSGISANGRYVAFVSLATDLVSPGTALGRDHVYRKDLQTGSTRLCSCSSGGVQGNSDSGGQIPPSLSADGQYVAFPSVATNLSPDANTGRNNILRKDVSTGQVDCCSISASGVKANQHSYMGDMTPDGRFTVFHSEATNLVDGTATSGRQVLLKELGAYAGFYFAEGYTGTGFQEYLCLGNPGAEDIYVSVTYLFSDAPAEVRLALVPAGSRTTIDVNAAVGAGRSVSIRAVCEDPFVAERPMYFAYEGAWTGGSDVLGAPWPDTSWYFAEGYTGNGFNQWVSVLNPGSIEAALTFRFQTQEAGEVVRSGYAVPAGSRGTFLVNEVLGPDFQSSLTLQSDQPVVAERPMYFNYLGRTGSRNWTGGHCVMGTTWLKRDYYFAEGYTGTSFDEYLTLQNPNPFNVTVGAVYQFRDGSPATGANYEVPAGTRHTVIVPDEVGTGREVSVQLGCAHPFLAERPMYFRYSGTAGHAWTGGHCVIGASRTSDLFYFAEGYTGDGFEQYLCVQNPGGSAAVVGITYFVQGAGPLPEREVTVPANSRETVLVNEDAGEGLQLSCRVRSLAGPRVVVERPMYFDFRGWTGGHDVVGFTP